jgi:hypothetical protein
LDKLAATILVVASLVAGIEEANMVKRGLPNDAEIKVILDAHNAYRRKAGASNMEELAYSPCLATMAQVYADKCYYEHAQPKCSSGTAPTDLGQNFYSSWGMDSVNWNAVVESWHSEVTDYKFDDNSCATGACGHYTQVVWAKSQQVGCAYSKCAKFTEEAGPMDDNALFVICNYAPGGNVGDDKPFTKGAACSACAVSGAACVDGLCKSPLSSPPGPCACSAW